MRKIGSLSRYPYSTRQLSTCFDDKGNPTYPLAYKWQKAENTKQQTAPVSAAWRPVPNCAPWEGILPVLPPVLSEIILNLPGEVQEKLEEVRLRHGRPLIIGLAGEDCLVDRKGNLTKNCTQAYFVTGDDIQRVTQLVSGCSLYAFEEEIKNGFITLPGGHRVGLTGKTVLEKGRVKTLKYISGLNIRIARAVNNIAAPVLPYLLDYKLLNIYHTLIFSPPRCGKTTLLRDLIRQISNGIPNFNFPGLTVGLVDERSELAGCYRGVPQHDVGIRTDVLDGCPKAEGMIMLLRSMAPQVIATDEIGGREDVSALEEVFNAGVKIIVTVHGSSLTELTNRPALNYLINLKLIDRYVLLGRSKGNGTVEEIIDGKFMKPLEHSL